jgi:hypothetical protein
MLNAGISRGSKTAPTVCNFPCGAKVVKKELLKRLKNR